MFNFRKKFCEEKNNNASKEVKLMKVEDYLTEKLKKIYNEMVYYKIYNTSYGNSPITKEKTNNPYYFISYTEKLITESELEEEKKQIISQSFSFRR